MENFETINAIEDEYRLSGKPTLPRAYELLLERWESGARDRETALRLLFLAWYSYSEGGNTGLFGHASSKLFGELASALDVDNTHDEEICFVISVMTAVAAWPFGRDIEESYWEQLGEECRRRLGQRLNHISPDIFEGRGEYGSYFAHQARNHWHGDA